MTRIAVGVAAIVLLCSTAATERPEREEAWPSTSLWAFRPAIESPLLAADSKIVSFTMAVVPEWAGGKYTARLKVFGPGGGHLHSQTLENLDEIVEFKMPDMEGLITIRAEVSGEGAPRIFESRLYRGDFEKGRLRLRERGIAVRKNGLHGKDDAAARFPVYWPDEEVEIVTHRELELFAQTDCALSRMEHGSSPDSSGRAVPAVIPNRLYGEIGSEFLKFWWILPEDYDPREKWPLVVFLHGSEGRGRPMTSALYNPMFTAIARDEDIHAVVLIAKSDGQDLWQPRLLDLLLDWSLEHLNVSEERVTATGVSMGGKGSWEWAMHSPDRLAAIAPLAGNANPIGTQKITHIPVWNRHGVRDPLVDFHLSALLVEMLDYFGGGVYFDAVSDAGHNVWSKPYGDPYFWRWLVGQRRRPPRVPENALLFDDRGLTAPTVKLLPPFAMIGSEIARTWDAADPQENSRLVSPIYQCVYDNPDLKVYGPHIHFMTAGQKTRVGVPVRPSPTGKLEPYTVWNLSARKALSVFYSGPRSDVNEARREAIERARSDGHSLTGKVITRVWWEDRHDGSCFVEWWMSIE